MGTTPTSTIIQTHFSHFFKVIKRFIYFLPFILEISKGFIPSSSPSLRCSRTNHASSIYSDLYTTKHEIPPLLQSDSSNKEGAPSLPVLVTNSPRTIEQWLSTHCGIDVVLGFDSESTAKPVWFPERATLPDGPSTVQLSTVDSCLIVHLARCGDGTAPYAPDALRAVLNDSTVVKTGVGIDADAIELYRWGQQRRRPRNPSESIATRDDWNLRCRFDLGGVGGGTRGRLAGIQTVAAAVARVHLPKGKKLAMSNWSKRTLTPGQVAYAARDAWGAAAVVDTLATKRPDVFGAEPLRRMCVGVEREVADMEERARRRREAKKDWKVLKEDGGDQEQMKKLWKVVQDTKPDLPNIFDGKELGFDDWGDDG